jgi:TolB protein
MKVTVAARFALSVALSAAFVAGPMLTQNAAADFPGQNGRITFMKMDSAGFWQIWVATAHLTKQKQITRGSANSGWPVWSPDGKTIAFDTDRTDPDLTDSTAINDIFTMNPDGSHLRNLTGSKGFNADAAWSPDGSLITFDSDRGDYPAKEGIYVMRSDGTNVRRITHLPVTDVNDTAPRFAPDGSAIVFTRFRKDLDYQNSALFTVHPDGRHVRRLTSFAVGAGDADWSPNSRRIVFEAYPSQFSHGQIDVMNADGSGLRNLTEGVFGSADPVWSPDGSRILFLQGVSSGGVVTLGLATMTPGGSRRHFISHTPTEEHQPDWQSR